MVFFFSSTIDLCLPVPWRGPVCQAYLSLEPPDLSVRIGRPTPYLTLDGVGGGISPKIYYRGGLPQIFLIDPNIKKNFNFFLMYLKMHR